MRHLRCTPLDLIDVVQMLRRIMLVSELGLVR
jgi:hypothetical protein